MTDTRIQRNDRNRPRNRQTEDVREMRRMTFPVDVYETEDDVLLVADMPGVGREDLDIQLERHELTIEGHRKRGDESWYYRRAFTLPDTVDADRITAECKHGELRLTLPKSEAVKPRRIEISGE